MSVSLKVNDTHLIYIEIHSYYIHMQTDVTLHGMNVHPTKQAADMIKVQVLNSMMYVYIYMYRERERDREIDIYTL